MTMLQAIGTMPTGRHPDGLALDVRHQMAYVANFYDGTLSVLDLDRCALVATLPVGERVFAVALDAVTDMLCVTAWRSHDLWLVERTTQQVMHLPIGYYDGHLALDPVRGIAYLAAYGPPKEVVVVDVRARRLVARTPVAYWPTALALDPVDATPYAVAVMPPDVAVARLDPDSLAVQRAMPFGPLPFSGDGAAVVVREGVQDHPLVFVVNGDVDVVNVVDATQGRLVATVPVGSRPRGVAVDQRAHLVYVTNWNDNTLSSIDARSLQVVDTTAVGRGPHAVAIDVTTHRLYVTNNWDDCVTILEPQER